MAEMDVLYTLLEVCDVCGNQHPTEACPELGLNTTTLIEQTKSRARLTLPAFLFELDIAGEVGVFTRDSVLVKKTQFGPFEAKKTTHEFSDDGVFILKVTTKDGTCISLDTTNENDCNWMCLIRAALTSEEQNCIAYQMGTNLYYSTTKDIPPGTELRVWYAPAYARRVGKPELPDGVSKVMLGMKVIYPSVEHLPDSLQPDPHTDENVEEESEVDPIPTGKVTPTFSCKRCGDGFQTESDLALHLRHHIIPNYSPLMNGKQRKKLKTKGQTSKKRGRKPKAMLVAAKRMKLESPAKYESEEESDTVEGKESVKDEGEKEENSDEEFTPVAVSTSSIPDGGRRIQPRRSLKGVRTSGFEADKNFVYVKIKTEKPDDGYGVSFSKSKNLQGKDVTDDVPSCETPVCHIKENGVENEEVQTTVKRKKRGRPQKVKITESSEVENSVRSPLKHRENSVSCDDHSASKTDLTEGRKMFKGEMVDDNKDVRAETDKTSVNENNSIKSEEHKRCDKNEKDEDCNLPAKVADGRNNHKSQKDSTESNENEACKGSSVEQTDSTDQEIECGNHKNDGLSPEDSDLLAYNKTIRNSSISDNQTNDKTVVVKFSSNLNEPMEENVDQARSNVDLVPNQAESNTTANNPDRIHMPSVESIANITVDDDLQNILDELDKTNANMQGNTPSLDKEEDMSEEKNPARSELEETVHQEKEAADKDTQTPVINDANNNDDDNDDDDDDDDDDEDADEKSVDKDEESNRLIETGNYSEGEENDKATMPFHDYVAKLVGKSDELQEDSAEFVNDITAKQLLHDKTAVEVDSKEDFLKYMRIEETSEGKHFICSLCDKKFLHEKYLRLHFPVHTGKFKCKKCGAKFCRNDSLKRHQCTNASKGTRLPKGSVQSSSSSLSTCDICGQQFSNQKYLFRHMAIHTNIFQCLTCQKSFSRKDSLQRHILKCCPEDAEQYSVFICGKCQKTFATKLGCENHETHCRQKMCKQCHSVFASENLFLAHKCHSKTEPSRGGGVKYNCSQCPKSFSNLNYLKQHLQIHEGGYICQLCGRKLKTKEEKEEHEKMCMALSMIQNEGKTKCTSCDLQFTDARLYREHYHSHTHPHQCSKCQKRFVKIGSLHSHVCMVEEEKSFLFSCTVCNKDFRTSRLLLRHKEIHQEHKYQCQHCDKKFYRRDYYLKHVCKDADGIDMVVDRNFEIRAQQDKLVCHICGKNFVSSSNLNKHMKVHGEKTCVCHICNKRFHYAEYLRVHLEGFHNKKHQYQCAECGKILTSKPGLTSHVKQFHSDEKEAYPCPTCGKVFSQKGNMKTHMYSHTKERGFQCTYCTKAFKYPDQLNRHKLIHTMQNKLQCDHCEKKFTKLYDLKKHFELFHSGMMYVCDVCGARTGHRHTMVRHYKRKHPEMAEQAKEPSYLNSLFKHVDKEEPEVPNEEIIEDQLNSEVLPVNNVSNLICGEEFVPQSAAEVLHSLSNTNVAGDQPIIVADGTTVIQNPDGTISMPGQEGTFSIQNIQQAVEGPDGQSTVVILQFVGQQDSDGVTQHQEVQVQEVDTQIITAGTVQDTGEEVETYIHSYVVSDQLQEAVQ
ncbi:uncharacterized protein LOC132545298 [Ylistrum balloti]|uniref:uncharacterized protein LOC132545298 n=1 Tax=Ylistrum balloti TaxID=509963 RepID=UPI002905F75D|nr:uncharacterized protein LOC132545298 [Ylistrum balloti]